MDDFTDVEMRRIVVLLRCLYGVAVVYFGHGFWLAREALRLPEVGLSVVSWLGLLAVTALLGLIGVGLFAKQKGADCEDQSACC